MYDFCTAELLCGLCRSRHLDGVKFRMLVRGGDFDCPAGKPWVDQRWIPPRVPYVSTIASSDRLPAAKVPANPEAQRRFEICKTCEHSENDGFKCRLRAGCCFGRWRSDPASACPAVPPKWLAHPLQTP
jgi:hypothetical protein